MATALAVLFFGMAALGLLALFRTINRIGKPVDTVVTGQAAAISAFFNFGYAVVFVTAGIILLQAR